MNRKENGNIMSNKKIKKTKVKINAFDVFVILLVLCLIATAVYKLYGSASINNGGENADVTVKFKCDGEYDVILDYLSEGDAVYLESGKILGYISKDSAKKDLFEVSYKADENGETPSVDDTAGNTYKMIAFAGEIKLNGSASKSGRGAYYVIGEDNVTVGGKLTVHTKNCEFTITVTDIFEDFS